MPAKKTVIYECDVCGTEVTVNSEGMSSLSPIYCCGSPLSETKRAKPQKKAAPRKKVAAKPARKAAAKGSRKRK